ncbi:O-antigen ligase family protein [Rhodopirellula europaea]|uniref:O-antigen ligase family protein n=1 Tax=Rhodopirellula europaea TaxID=1263866 RepID=UPI003D2D7A68
MSLESTDSDNPDGSVGLKPMHAFAIAMGIFVLPHLKQLWGQLCRNLITLGYFSNGLLVSSVVIVSELTIDVEFIRISPVVLKFAFAFYSLLLGYDLANRIPKDQFVRMVRVVSWVTLIAILVKAQLYMSELRAPPTREGWKPDIPLFFAGGVNIESSMMVMAACLFVGRKSFFPFILGAGVVSVLYLSRAATLGCFVAVALTQFNLLRLSILRAVVAVGLISAVISWVFTNDMSFFLSRFSTIGTDSSSSTRLYMLSGVQEAFMRWPLGHGAGNAIYTVETLQGDLRAGNLHNVFAQTLLDFGVQGLILWILLIANHLRQLYFEKFECPLGLYTLLYFVLSLIQFTGLETFFWLMLGSFQGYHLRSRRVDAVFDASSN